ncbi:LAFA_0D12728g1_1 [Lachancea sp. 'fantastica']|nr:LAFA_0D12728g1_1 [Lachancea sp. 'fantastica']
MTNMKAIQLQGQAPPNVFLIETDIPKPGLGTVLVKIRASAIQPSDLLNAKGGFPYTTFPRICGRDYAGTIVSGPRSGENVYGTSGFTYAFTQDGFHAEYALVAENALARKPTNLSFVQAACIGVPFTTAKLIARKTEVKSSDIVLVIGANGSVGSAVVQLTTALGCRVLTAGRNDNMDVNTDKDPELATVSALTDQHGVDVVIDTVGIPATTTAAIKNMAHGGKIAIIAAPGDVNLTFDMKDLYRHEKSVIGCNSLSYDAQTLALDMAQLTLDFESGKLQPSRDEVWTTVSLEKAVDVYKFGPKARAKFVIVMDH